ncbi:MAG: carbohydrate kinase family protein [Candidatus Riflebacteria bacterium]|nr:carbohydrate kinase family protein [Candidatus Riflebacteria bacterium]
MAQIVISGLINIETTVQIERFPVEYCPVRYPFFGVGTTVSGVGYNLASAFSRLGDNVRLVSFLGNDLPGNVARASLKNIGFDDRYIVSTDSETPQSVILYNTEGKRQINVDLKDIQQRDIPDEHFEKSLSGAELAVMCNINFSRRHLEKVRQSGIMIASDVHAISSLEDSYNMDFMRYSDILFCSDESLSVTPEEWSEKVIQAFGKKIVVVGMGSKGAFIKDANQNTSARLPAVDTRPIVNTIGAGDSLFSSFLHYFVKTRDSLASLKKAIIFASWKIGEKGAAKGFLSEKELEELELRLHSARA